MSAKWEELRLEEVLELRYGKALPATARNPQGNFPVYGANGEKDRSNSYLYDRPSIIVGRKGSAGELNLTESKFWALDVTYYVVFDEKRHDLQFLYYLLGSLDLPSMAKGVKPGINRSEVYARRVKVPSLKEEQRIVALLDCAFENIASAREITERKLVALSDLERSLLGQALSGHL